MKPYSTASLGLLPLLLAALLTSCGQARSSSAPLILAPVSLQGVLDEQADHWAAAGHPRPVISYGGTPSIARQVQEGAPADLFLSADARWMEVLRARGLVRPDTVAIVATNSLVIVTQAEVPGPSDLSPAIALARGRIAVADPTSVPAGRYAKAALTTLAIWKEVEPRLIPAENVRAALALVERGAVPLGLVYATDARASARVRIVGTIPATTHPPIIYPIAQLTRSSSGEAAGFRRFLLNSEARRVFVRHGFGAP